MALKVLLLLEEPATGRVHGVPTDVVRVVAQVCERIQLRVAVLARQRLDHLRGEVMPGAQDVWVRNATRGQRGQADDGSVVSQTMKKRVSDELMPR